MNFALFKSHLMVIAIENNQLHSPCFCTLGEQSKFHQTIKSTQLCRLYPFAIIGQLAQNYLPSQGQTGMQN